MRAARVPASVLTSLQGQQHPGDERGVGLIDVAGADGVQHRGLHQEVALRGQERPHPMTVGW